MRRSLILALLACIVLSADAQALICNLCRQQLVGQYTVYEGKNLHDSCYYKHYARYCHICEGAIEGQYIHNSWGDMFCAVHIGEYPLCEFCERLKAEKLTGRGTRYRDGREICGVCYSSAVKNTKEAEGILDSVTITLLSYGIQIDPEYELELVDKLRMASLTPAVGREAWGFSHFQQQSTFFGLVTSQDLKVYALSGMPKVLLMAVLAHELMHVWLFANAPLEMDHVLVEGSCEYVAHLVLKGRTETLARQYLESQMANKDLAYGGGFRSVHQYVGRVGVPAWLDYLSQNEQPPW